MPRPGVINSVKSTTRPHFVFDARPAPPVMFSLLVTNWFIILRRPGRFEAMCDGNFLPPHSLTHR